MRQIFILAFLALALVFMPRSGLWAQDNSLPTPQATGTVITDQESAILKGFFKKLNEASQGDPEADAGPTISDIVTDVIKTVNTDSADQKEDKDEEDESDSDKDEEGDSDKDQKKDKKKNKGKDKKKDKKKNKGKDKKKGEVKGRGNGLPPGLQKQLDERGTLPPGLQKRLRDSGALPPGLQASGLPEELESELPELPEGQQRIIVDNDVLIIEEVTGRVLDAIPDVIPPDLAPILNQLPTIFQQQE